MVPATAYDIGPEPRISLPPAPKTQRDVRLVSSRNDETNHMGVAARSNVGTWIDPMARALQNFRIKIIDHLARPRDGRVAQPDHQNIPVVRCMLLIAARRINPRLRHTNQLTPKRRHRQVAKGSLH